VAGLRRKKARSLRRALVAAGQAVDISDPRQIDAFRKRFRRTQLWQLQAYFFTEEIPEVGFANDYTRDSMSRVGLVPAVLPDDPSERPVPLDDDTTPDGLDRDLCAQILSRLEPFPDLMGRIAAELDTAGECHVLLYEDEDDVDGECCRVLSVEELTTRDRLWVVKDEEEDTNGRVIVEAQGGAPYGAGPGASPYEPRDSERAPLRMSPGGLFRIWQPDRRWRNRPDAPMRRLLGVCDELLLLTQLVQGIARSRIAMTGRILAIADEFSLDSASPGPTEDAGDGAARDDPFIEDLMVAATAAMTDPTSAAAALPLIIRGRHDLLRDGIISIDLDRKIDEMTLALRREAIERIANGVNLPREVVLGIGATNHWNAEEIRNQAWKVHLEPRAMTIAAAITEAFYRPQLLAEGVDPEIVRRCVVGYDPTWFVGTPDLAESANEALDRFAISWEAYRRATGWDPDDAPDEDEVKLRLWIEQQKKVTERVALEGVTGEVEGTPSGPGTQPIEEATPVEETAPEKVPGTPQKTAPAPAPAAALVAAGRRRGVGQIGARLSGIERDLRARLQADANAVAARALERAGAKVRSAASRRKIAAEMEQWPVAEIPANMGRAGVQMLGLNDEELLAGALGTFGARYAMQVQRGQEAAARAAADAVDGRDIDPDDLNETMEPARNHGWQVLAAGMGLLLSRILYDPHPQAPPVGEFDAASVIPVGLIRASLNAAGGAQVPVPQTVDDVSRLVDAFRPGDRSSEGMGATGGPDMTTIFSESLGIEAVSRTWVYGDAVRSREFQPHNELDGLEFSDWDDPRLANDEDWPPVDYYIPGDHDGCMCDVEITFAEAATGEGAGTEEAA